MTFRQKKIIHYNLWYLGGLFAVSKDLTEMLTAEYEMSDAYDDNVDVIVTPEMVRFSINL